MQIRKLSGEADGWSVTECLRTCSVWDKDDNVQNVVAGTKYYTKGKTDPSIFKEDKPARKVKEVEDGPTI